jgi:cysteine desulfurase
MPENTSIYLDYNATAPLKPEVVQAMAEVLALPLNASSVHGFGRTAKKIVEDTRRKLAERMNCWPQEIIWCAGASEANNSILSLPGSVLVSAIEHSSILKASKNAEYIPVTTDGIIHLEWLKNRLAQPEKPAMISVMFANNETGVIQPIKEIVEIAHAHSVLVHTDAVQAVGKMPIDFSSLGADYMTLAFHKCGAPQGIAALLVANGRPFTPFIKGGGQEFNRRAGTENVAALAGLAAWLDLPDDYAHMHELREWLDEMEFVLRALGVEVASVNAKRLPNTSCLILPNQSQEITLMQADLAGFAISAGSACSSGRIEPSHVLTAMGYGKAEASRAIRISGGWNTKKEDIERLTKHFLKQNVKQVAG